MRMILIPIKCFCPLLITQHMVFPVSHFPEDKTRTVVTFYTCPPEASQGLTKDMTEASQPPPWCDIASQRTLRGIVFIPRLTKLYIFFKWHNHSLQTRACLPWDIFVFSEIIVTLTLGNINKKNWKKIQCTLIMQALQNLVYLASFHFQEENQWHWANWMNRRGK